MSTITFAPGIAWHQTWHNGDDRDSSAMNRAVGFLTIAGFSVGRQERGSPRGILFGDFDIQKWRNLDEIDRMALHGTMTGDMRHGPVTVTIFLSAPEAAREAIAAALLKGLPHA